MSKALPQLLRLIKEIISGAARSSSIKRPTRKEACKPKAISVCMLANFNCTNWLAAKGLPNCLRSKVY